MHSTNFPKIVDYARSVLVSTSPHAGLTVIQRDKQQELRSQSPTLGSGLILPFYSREQRDLTATGGDGGSNTIGTAVPEIGTALRGNLVLERLGARIFGGLTDDLRLPRAKVGISAAWLSENASGTAGLELTSALPLKPKRVTAYLDVSRQLLLQSASEAFLRQELMAALATEIQRVVIGGTGSSNEPTGILASVGVASVVGGTDGAAPTYSNLCDLEYAVTGTGKADRGNVAWLCSPKARKKLRQTFVNGSGSAPIWSLDAANSLLGRAAGATPSVPDNLTKGASSGICSAIIVGEMSELFVGLWGAGVEIEVTTNQTYAKLGLVMISATSYVDCGVRSPEAFAIMSDAIC